MTITFPPQVIGDDTIQAYLTVDTVSTPSTPQNVIMEDYGEISYKYDPEQRFLVPAQLTCKIKDLDHDLSDIIFSSNFTGDTQDIKMEVYINSSSDYIGYALPDQIFYDEGERTLTMTFSPKIDEINKTMILDLDGNPTDPFGYGSAYVSMPLLLQDIFQRANTGVTWASGRIEFNHSWKFRGSLSSDDTTYIDTITLDEVMPNANYIYADATNGLRNCGDVLRTLAVEFGAFTGMTKHDKAFFKQLYTYDSSNTQSVTVLNKWKKYAQTPIEFVRFTDAGNNVFTKGTYNEVEGSYLDREGQIVWFYNDNPVYPWGNAGYNVIANHGGLEYYLRRVQDSVVSSSWYEFGELGAEWWYYWRSDLSRAQVDSFLLNGVDYDYLKDFTYDSTEYQIFNMTKKLNVGLTEIDAFNLG